MSLVRYEPWSLFGQRNADVARIFNAGVRRPLEKSEQSEACDWTPAVDIREEEGRYVIHADVPGVKPDDIEVKMDDGVLLISGKRHCESSEEHADYRRVERVRGSFSRRFSLPETADADGISARSSDGVLEVVIPKQAKVLPKRIKVES